MNTDSASTAWLLPLVWLALVLILAPFVWWLGSRIGTGRWMDRKPDRRIPRTGFGVWFDHWFG